MKNKITNKRKRKFFNYNINLVIIFCLVFFLFFYIYFNFNKISYIAVNFIEKYSDEYGYNLTNIEINDLKYINKNEILMYFDKLDKKSIFLIPIKKISKDILDNKWIKTLDIQSDYRNTIRIFIEEEIPMGIYDNNTHKILFSQNLEILKILENDDYSLELITFYGENAIINSKKLISNLPLDFIDSVNSAIFVNKRRWNLRLKNFILLKLPQKNIIHAINNYKKIYKNFSNKDLEVIESIDLRINKQAIIKYKKFKDD